MAGKPWFAPKRFGYGTGLPISWEGWLALAVFVGGVVGSAALTKGATRIAIFACLTLVFLLICVAKTRGGWRWRSGGEDD